MHLIDMQSQNLFHFSRTDLYSLADRYFFFLQPVPLLHCSLFCSEGAEFRTAAGIVQQLDWRIDLGFLAYRNK